MSLAHGRTSFLFIHGRLKHVIQRDHQAWSNPVSRIFTVPAPVQLIRRKY